MRRALIAVLLLTACTGATGEPGTSTSAATPNTTSTPSSTTSTVATTITTTTTSQATTTTTEPATTTTTSRPPNTSTSTTGPATTTTTTEALGDHCRPQMFTAEVREALARDYPSQRITAHVYDTRTGCSYSLNPGNRQNPASVFKVMVMAGTLLEAQAAGRPVSDWEMAQMVPMITESTNTEVRNLWNHFGGSPWFQEQANTFGLSQTTVIGDEPGSSWGNTQTSARDQVNLLRQVLLGHFGPLEADYRAVALELMTSVVPTQTWGVTAGVPSGWTVAQKNGFAGVTTNSVGWVDEPGPSEGYVVAILTRGWSSWEAGVGPVERISRIVAEALTSP
jgi:beta-lactamase class A